MMPLDPDKTIRILVVDDEPTLRLGFTFALETESYQVDAASNGREGLEELCRRDYDLVILDLRMPEMDGLETLTAIRDDQRLHDLPVILCSAHINATTAIRALNQSCFHFLSKPVRPAELRKQVATLVQPEQQTTLEHIASELRAGNRDVVLKKIPELDHGCRGHPSLWRSVFRTLANGHNLKSEEITASFPDLVDCLLLK